MSDKVKTFTTVYFPKNEADWLLKATKLRGEQLYGRGNSGKTSAYIINLIKKDLKAQGLLEVDKSTKTLVPIKSKFDEIEREIQKKQEQDLYDDLLNQ